MSRRALLALGLAAGLLARPALAIETPRPDPTDPRIRTLDYDPRQVVRIVGAVRTATQIRFAGDETILHVALGDSSGWEVAAETSLLFAKPIARVAPTNLIVTTRTADGEMRHYAFQLAARSGRRTRDRTDTVFMVQFRYPEAEKTRLQRGLSAEAQALERRVLQLKLDHAVLQGSRNLDYVLQGSAAIAPSEVTDNGRFTVMRFPGAQPVPAVYAVSPDGAEALVPFDVRGEFLVVHQTARQLRLRRGRAVLCLFNLSYDPAGPTTGTGTAAPDVTRTRREEGRK